MPLAVLNRVHADDFAWQVPGLRQELVTALIKTLPKPLRVKLVPAPDTARAAARAHQPRARSTCCEALSPRGQGAARGAACPWRSGGSTASLTHLRPTFRVVDDGGAALAEGKDLDELKTRLAAPVQEAIASAAGDLEVSGLTAWTIEEVPVEVAPGSVVGYPALVDEGTSVAPAGAACACVRRRTAPAYVACCCSGCRRPVKAVSGRLTNQAKLALAANPHGSLPALMDDCLAAAVGHVPRRHRAARRRGLRRRARCRPWLGCRTRCTRCWSGVEKVLALAAQLERTPGQGPVWNDVQEQRRSLVHDGFVTEVGAVAAPGPGALPAGRAGAAGEGGPRVARAAR